MMEAIRKVEAVSVSMQAGLKEMDKQNREFEQKRSELKKERGGFQAELDKILNTHGEPANQRMLSEKVSGSRK